MSHHPPTAEQVAIRDAFATGDQLVIEAGAGAGKTTTLRMLAEAAPRQRGVYIAYNRAIAQDAAGRIGPDGEWVGFPRSVTCKTAHSFAMGAVGRHYRDRLNGPRVPAQVTATILRLNEPVKLGEIRLAPQQLARLAMETVTRWCYTAAEQVEQRHVPLVNGLDLAGQAGLARLLVPVAQRAWDEDLTRVDGRLRFQHDHYLKMWTLSRPQLPADYVLLDEAQDSNGCVAGLVDDQQAQRIWVGDRCQAIYGWRGATDAMEHAPGRRLYLSRSFRFGARIAEEANKWLEVLAAPLRLTGFDQLDSRVGRLAESDAVLCRTNAGAITQAIAATGRGRRAALVGGGQDIRRMAEAAEQLQQGRGTGHPELFAFSSWGEVRAYVEQESEGSDLRVLVRLIDQHGPRELIRIVDSLADEKYADVVISTAHKAKGREWQTVRIAGDFQEPKPGEDGVYPDPARDEAMLAYVAVTRAQQALDREGLSWVDRYVDLEPQAASFDYLLVDEAQDLPQWSPAETGSDPQAPAAAEPTSLTPTQQARLAGVAAAAPAYVRPVDPAAEPVPERVDPAERAWEGLRADREAMLAGEPLCPACETHGELLPDGLCAGCSPTWDQTGCHPDAAGLVDVGPAYTVDDRGRYRVHHAGDPPAQAGPEPVLIVPHCRRCGSDACICGPEQAAAWSARNGAPAGPRLAREAWARARMAGAR